MSSILHFAIDTPLRRVFDYLPPAEGAGNLQPGQRAWLPFGRRRVMGLLLNTSTHSEVPQDKLRRVVEMIDDEPVLDTTLLGMLQWAADYYHHPIGEVVVAALPGNLRHGAPHSASELYWQITEPGRQRVAKIPARATRTHGLLMLLHDGERHHDKSLAGHRTALLTLLRRGDVEQVLVKPERVKTVPQSSGPMPDLSDAQRNVLDTIAASLGSFRTLLLYGVTGSGKTEVYLRAIDAVLQRGEQALVLAPEIALTPQLVERFRSRFNIPIAVLHSGLNNNERLSAWRAARDGSAGVVIGTRSAIFTTLAKPGLIIVDEEHDGSYKQQEGFRYSARDLAIVRAQRHGIPVILGSATPALETLQRTRKTPADLMMLPQRAGFALPPTLKLVDLRHHAANQGLSTPVMQAIRTHLDAQGQILLYLNRRGYAPVLFCPQCGWSAPCISCDAKMTVHLRQRKLQCHHCGHEQALLSNCPSCHADVKPVGQGTERIEDTLQILFPDAPVARIDRDSISHKGELHAVLERVNSGEAKILIGTQMLAKGHHFPNVTLAAILNADQGLFSADFRGSEKLAQSILQVAGRAGRGDRAGEVLIQTEYPDHPLLQRLLSGGYDAFVDAALHEREAAQWPPYSRLVLLRAEAKTTQGALQFLYAAKALLNKTSHNTAVKSQVFGPAPAPMMRRAGVHRAQLLLRATQAAALQRLLDGVVAQLEVIPEAKHVRWSVDVDPVELF
jgi:primosomal protein N' (replication factor Y)